MTMRTPTGELAPALEAPEGLPDVAALARLANAFFTALPGAAPADSGARAPAQLPADVSSSPPAVVSELPAAAPAAGVSPPLSPFYFLSSAGSGWNAGSAAAALPNIAAFTAQPTALPAGLDLSALRAAPASGLVGAVPAPHGAPTFYFLESLPAADVRALQGLGAHAPFDVTQIRRDFPILAERVNGRPLIWLDNAATTQKPQAVIDRLANFYAHENSNIHRAAHELAARATDAYEGARATVQRFLGASSPEEIVFVRGATEAINLVAQSWGRQNILAGDEIIVSHLEHHANIVPWQQLATEERCTAAGHPGRRYRTDSAGRISQASVPAHQAGGHYTSVERAGDHRARARGRRPRASRRRPRVDRWRAGRLTHAGGCARARRGLLCILGHKVFGPTGIGVLYGTAEILESMPRGRAGAI